MVAPMQRFRDDLGRDVCLVRPPRRVVSLVPSDTYTLFALGCGERVVGRTAWCDRPVDAAAIPVVGGPKDVDVDAVLAQAPELVIANQEENTRPGVERLDDRCRRRERRGGRCGSATCRRAAARPRRAW